MAGAGLSVRLSAESVAGAGLLLFAASAWLSPFGVSLGLILMWSGFLADGKARCWLVQSTLFWSAVVFCLYLAGLTWYSINRLPDTRQVEINALLSWIKLFSFFPIAWCLAGRRSRYGEILCLCVAGLLLHVFIHMDWDNFWHMRLEKRTGLGFNPIFSGFIFGEILLGILVLWPRIKGVMNARSGVVVPGIYGVTLFSFYGFIESGSKSAWIPFLLVLIYFAGFTLVRRRKLGVPLYGRHSRAAVLSGLLILVLAGGTWVNAIGGRLQEERQVLSELTQGHWTQLPRSNTSYRFDLQRFGFAKWLEQPLIGWGPGTSAYLIRDTHDKNLFDRNWLPHTHNAYLEILLTLGLVGFYLLFVFSYLLRAGFISCSKVYCFHADYRLFVSISFWYFMIWSLFDFRYLHSDVRPFWLLLAGFMSANSYSAWSAARR
ncbi:MAG: O-antigen ligase family protein [Methylococcaceae bacterium]|jgi:O-antigen ligase